MGYLAPGNFFENMLQWKRCGLYFEGILSINHLKAYIMKHY